jgi:hypothetical protein
MAVEKIYILGSHHKTAIFFLKFWKVKELILPEVCNRTMKILGPRKR